MRDARGAFMAGGGGSTGVFVFERCASGMSAARGGQRLLSNNEELKRDIYRHHFSTVTSNTSTLFGGMSPVRCAP